MAGVPLTVLQQDASKPIIGDLPPVKNLPVAQKTLLVNALAATGRRYQSGDQEPNLAGDLFLLSRGCVALRSTGHFHRIVRGDAVLSPSDTGFGGPEILVLEPNTVLHRMPLANVVSLNAGNDKWALGMLDATAMDLAATRALRESTYAGMADYFEESGALLEGPYRSTSVRLILVVVEDDPPPPLPWNVLPLLPGSKRWIRAFSHYSNFAAPAAPASYTYQELAQLIPVVTAAGLGFHTRRMFPDGVMPTAVGRELYAFPKRCADVWMDDAGGGAAFQGKFMFHAEWTAGAPQSIGDWLEDLTAALLPGWAGTAGIPALTGALTPLIWPVLGPLGFPLRIFTEREGFSHSPLTPLGNDELVRAPFRFVVKEPRSLNLQWVYDVNRLGLKALGAFEVEVDIELKESYAVRDRTGFLRFLRNPWLAAQVPFRTLREILP